MLCRAPTPQENTSHREQTPTVTTTYLTMCGKPRCYFRCGDAIDGPFEKCQAVQDNKECTGPPNDKRYDYDCREHWHEKTEPGVWPGKDDGFDDPDEPSGTGAGGSNDKRKKTKNQQDKTSARASGGASNGTSGQRHAASDVLDEEQAGSATDGIKDGEVTTYRLSTLMSTKQQLQMVDSDKENQGHDGEVGKDGSKLNAVERVETEEQNHGLA